MVADEPVVEPGRFQEAQLDLCIATLAQTSPSVVNRLWESVGEAPPSVTRVWLQEPRSSDGCPSDLLLVADDGRRIHIENKTRGGAFGRGQLVGYAGERQLAKTSTLLIAPDAFINGSAAMCEEAREAFDAMVPVTELAELAEDDAMAADAAGDLLRQWSAWLKELDVQTGYQGSPHESSEWVKHYRERIATESREQVVLADGTMRNGAATFAVFAASRPAPAPYSLTHKVTFGLLDLTVPGWVLTTLETFLADAEPALPPGWFVAKQKGAKRTKLTGAPTPALRFAVEPIDYPFPPFEECAHVVDVVIEQAGRIGEWLNDGGLNLLQGGPSPGLLERQIAAAADTAATLQDTECVQALQSLLKG